MRFNKSPMAYRKYVLCSVFWVLYFMFLTWDPGCGTSICLAEETDISSVPVEVSGDQVQYFEAEKKVVGEGRVVVTYKDIKMTCKKATAFLDSKEAIAEGDVVVARGDDILRGEKIIYNFQTETGTIVNGVAKADVWYGGGKEVKKISANEIDITDGYVTTCDLMKPHYAIRSKQVKIYLGKRVVARNVTFNVGGVPVMYLPVYSQPAKEKFPKITIVPGTNKDWGAYLLSSYRYNLSDDVKGNVHLDYRRNKGLGEGLDYGFKSDDLGNGYARLYYINECDKTQHTKKERWRAQYRHKWEVRPDTTGIVEYHKFKDVNFSKDYLYREEFERDPQPPTYATIIHASPNYEASLYVEDRVNKFFTDVERLPEAQINFKNQRLFEKLPVFYKGYFDGVNLNKEVANSTQQNHVIRADTYNQLAVPFRLVDFISVDPYIGTQQTFYTREIATDKNRFRGALYTGLDFSSNFYRVYDCKTDFLNLDISGMRHIFTPNVSYYYVQKPTLLPDKLFDFDDIDTLDKKYGIGLALENKLQTKRLNDKNELITSELLRFIIDADYFIRSSSMNHRLSDIDADLEIKPYTWLFIKQTALYDPRPSAFKSVNTDVTARDPKEKWWIGAGHRYEDGFSSQLTTEAEAKVTPKWKCRVYERYEFKGNELKEQEYTITRDLHCWEMAFTYSAIEKDSHTFWLIFRLKAFPEMPLKLGTSYYRPRTGSGSE